MASTPPRCPITTISNHAKNLERGQGGVWLNGMLEKLLSRLSVCSGACVPHSFCFIMFLAQASLEWRSVLGGRADGMLSGAAIGGSIINLLQLSAAPPFLSTTSWQVLRNLLA